MAQSHKIPGGLSAVNFVEATTPSGRVQGYVNQHGGVSFLGIPFAVPPIGNNRWKTTIPIPNWSGTLDATLQKPGCPQICKENYLCPPIISEDCLYLNIYVPPLEAGQTDISAKQRPVLFFVPGGAFRRGSSHLYDSEASTLAQRMDAVIVIVSYRLGPLGFFLTEAKEGVSHSPNYGVDDIRTAHAWVVKSISSFGGLPSEITLVGQSAGSLIGAYLIGAGNPNPITFKAAALLSIPNSPLRNLAEAEEDRQLLLKELGCSPNDIACARGKTAGALIGAEHDRETNLNGFMSFPLMPMIVDNLEVTSQPAYALQHDYRGNVPVLIGMTKAEGHEYVNTVSHRPLRKIIADAVLRTWWPTVSDSAVVKSYYTKDVLYKGYLDHFGFLVNLMTDYLFLCPSRQALKNLGSTSSSPAYGIFLDGGMSYKEDVPAGTYCDGAACHGVDILFMFTGTEPFANILTQAIRGLVHSADPNAYASESGVVIPQLSPATASGVPVAEIFRNGTSAAMPFPRNKYCDDWEALSADRPYDLRARAINRETSPFVLCVTLVSVILGGILLLHLAIFFRWKKFTKHSRTAVSADSVNARQPIQEPVPVAVAGLNVVLSGKYILSDVSLYFPAGKMTGLLGPSGAGKSTLIHHLTGSVGKGSARDVIFYGKSSLSHISVERLKRMIGLVEQTDCPYSSLTLQSVLEAAAVILLDSSTDEERLARVDEVTEILNLTGCVDVLVDKLSGGQKRRMTIAVQLLKKPPVLFLDEPTSGLDAETSLEVIRALKHLCNVGNHTVILTIHTPRREIWETFDQVALMSNGQVVFTGAPSDANMHFTSSGGKVKDPTINPADWIIDLIAQDSTGDYHKKFRASNHHSGLQTALSHVVHAEKDAQPIRAMSKSTSLSLFPSFAINAPAQTPFADVAAPKVPEMTFGSDAVAQPNGFEAAHPSNQRASWVREAFIPRSSSTPNFPPSPVSSDLSQLTTRASEVRSPNVQSSESPEENRHNNETPPVGLKRMATDCSLSQSAADALTGDGTVPVNYRHNIPRMSAIALGTYAGRRPTVWTVLWASTLRWWRTGPIFSKFSYSVLVLILSIVGGLLCRRNIEDDLQLTLRAIMWQIGLTGLSVLKSTEMVDRVFREKRMYQWEMRQGMATPLSFWLHLLITETWPAILEPLPALLAFCVIFDPPIFHRSEFGVMILAVILFHHATTSMFSLIERLPVSDRVAVLASTCVVGLIAFFSGAMVKEGQTPVYDGLSFIQYISPGYWGFRVVTWSAVGGQGVCLFRSIHDANTECAITEGDLVSKAMGDWPDHPNKWESLLIQLALSGALRLLQLIILYGEFYSTKMSTFGRMCWLSIKAKVQNLFKATPAEHIAHDTLELERGTRQGHGNP